MRALAREYLGGKCVACGATDGLDFHHRDPAEKSFAIADQLLIRWSRLVAELDKCELRCGEHHADQHRSSATHGTVQRWWRGCRCAPCTEAHRAYRRAYQIEYRSRVDPNRRESPRLPKGEFKHGTRAGYLKERREGLDPCTECKAANATYTAALKARRATG